MYINISHYMKMPRRSGLAVKILLKIRNGTICRHKSIVLHTYVCVYKASHAICFKLLADI